MKPGDRVVYIGKNYKHGTVFVLKREIDHGWWTNDASFVYKSNIVPEREYMFNKLVDEYYGL